MKLRIRKVVEKQLVAKLPVMCSRKLGELLKKYKNSDPETFRKVNLVAINERAIYYLRRENCRDIPVREGDVVYLYSSKANKFGLGFFQDV